MSYIPNLKTLKQDLEPTMPRLAQYLVSSQPICLSDGIKSLGAISLTSEEASKLAGILFNFIMIYEEDSVRILAADTFRILQQIEADPILQQNAYKIALEVKNNSSHRDFVNALTMAQTAAKNEAGFIKEFAIKAGELFPPQGLVEPADNSLKD